MRPAAPAHLEIGQIEVPRLQKVRLDLLASVIRNDSVFERLDHHAEGFQLLLVALELAAHGFARLVVGLEPLSLVVVHLAQNLLARDRIAVLEEEGEEVEPALGLGHRGIPGLRARARRGRAPCKGALTAERALSGRGLTNPCGPINSLVLPSPASNSRDP